MSDTDQRKAAIKRLKKKRDFRNNVVSYVLINAFLVVIWAVGGEGFFWPVFVMAGWGVGLAMHGWKVYGQKPISEESIQHEMGRGVGA